MAEDKSTSTTAAEPPALPSPDKLGSLPLKVMNWEKKGLDGPPPRKAPPKP